MTDRHSHAPSDASPLQRDILRTLLYFDIFHHPLTAKEIYRYLPSDSTSPEEVESACSKPPLDALIRWDAGFFFLSATNADSPTLSRTANERRARRFMTIASVMGRLIRRFPFVRGLMISGELSKGVLSRKGDIDLLVVTAPGRVWVCRTFIIVFKKIFLLNRKRFLCVNHFVAEDYFEITERNLYTALELATLKPLFPTSFFFEYVHANPWIHDFFPNVEFPVNPSGPATRAGFLQSILEFPLRGRMGDALDVSLMNFWKKVWAKRYAHLPDEKRARLFQTGRSISTAYAGDFLTRVLSEYTRRLSDYHLDGALPG